MAVNLALPDAKSLLPVRGVSLGIAEGGIDQLRSEVEENMRRELSDNLRNRIKTVVLDKLWAAHPLDLPAAAVDEQVRALQIDWLRRIGVQIGAKHAQHWLAVIDGRHREPRADREQPDQGGREPVRRGRRYGSRVMRRLNGRHGVHPWV